MSVITISGLLTLLPLGSLGNVYPISTEDHKS